MHRSTKKRVMMTLGVSVIAAFMVAAVAYADGKQNAGSITRVGTAWGAAATSPTLDLHWQDVPGASVTLKNDKQSLYVVRFSGESTCDNASGIVLTTSGVCRVRFLVNGAEARPVVGDNFAFDTNQLGSATDGAEAHAIDRNLNIPAATPEVTVQVQYYETLNTRFTLDDWQLTVEQAGP
jgi:hypothetical protein